MAEHEKMYPWCSNANQYGMGSTAFLKLGLIPGGVKWTHRAKPWSGLSSHSLLTCQAKLPKPPVFSRQKSMEGSDPMNSSQHFLYACLGRSFKALNICCLKFQLDLNPTMLGNAVVWPILVKILNQL